MTPMPAPHQNTLAGRGQFIGEFALTTLSVISPVNTAVIKIHETPRSPDPGRLTRRRRRRLPAAGKVAASRHLGRSFEPPGRPACSRFPAMVTDVDPADRACVEPCTQQAAVTSNRGGGLLAV
ncbi:unnamed protein product [Urochloa humidicola]